MVATITFYVVCSGCTRFGCDGVGANELGMLLMAIRTEICNMQPAQLALGL